MNTLVKQAVVNAQTAMNSNMVSEQVAFFSTTGVPLFMVTALPTPANQLLSGYTVAASKLSLADGDSVQVALGKLEKRLVLGTL